MTERMNQKVGMKGEVTSMQTGKAGQEAGLAPETLTEVNDVMMTAEEAVLDHVDEGSVQAATSALALAHEVFENCPEGKLEMTLPGVKIASSANGKRNLSLTISGMKITFEPEDTAK